MRAITVFLLSIILLTSAEARMTPEQVAKLPPPASHTIQFTKEIKPILQVSCGNCHGRGKNKGDFRIDDRETFLKGGDSGPSVVVGKSEESLLIELVMGFDEDSVMPAKGSRLKPEQIGLLRAWIDQGLKWDEGVWLGKVEAKNLHPRLPEVPPAKKASNPIDAFVDAYFKTNGVNWPKPVDDEVFARRVHLDIIGLLPSAEELNKFLRDRSSDKREKLVQKLLADNRNYAEHWLTFWNDLLRNDYKGTGYIDGGRKQITPWLYSSLLTNKPYDQFVAELINPTPESEGFTKGIIWRGVVNASQIPEMQAAQSISQVFMGLNLKCASCHDSFINDWQLADAYSLANIYANETLEMSECDKPLGKKAGMKFLYPEFGEIDASADKPIRLRQLAASVTSEKNGRLPRTLVNRIWGRFFGRAFVEPVDDMEQAGWNQDLIDWLAEDFVANGHDIKHLITRIVLSRAYQLPAVDLGELQGGHFVFRGPGVRRMSAEQFRDALTSLTGIGYPLPDADVDASGAGKSNALPATVKWIWNEKQAADRAKAEHVFFRKTVTLDAVPTDARLIAACDNKFTLYINDQKVGEGSDFTRPSVFDIQPFLKKGDNLVAVHAINNLPGNLDPTPEKAVAGTENPAGLVLYARVRAVSKSSEQVMDFASDKSWLWSREKMEGWHQAAFAATNWAKSTELGNLNMAPWRLRKNIVESKLAEAAPGKVRASLVAADPLMIALGRPNREQVVTTRPTAATTLEALELTNGSTLSTILKRGAENLAKDAKSSRDLAQRIYQQALGRKPARSELKLAEELLGKPVNKEGVEDLLWAMTMLPEFQLIY